jgi:hypothetical protein
MRVVIAIKRTGGRGAARGSRYIAERDRDQQREGAEARPLFSEQENDLTYRRADSFLSRGQGTPDKDDIIHLAVSFQKEDYERLGSTTPERNERLREVAREAMTEVKGDLQAEELRWIAGIHLNTDHPHVHILIHKEIIDRDTGEPRRLGRIPKALLAYRESQPDGTTRPVEGKIGERFITALDRQIERAQQVEVKDKSEIKEQPVKSFGEWLRTEVRARNVAASWTAPDRDDLPPPIEAGQDRLALGDALEKQARREYAEIIYKRATDHGETYRFKARDASVGTVRQISELDVRRRAEARGQRVANEASPRSAAERRDLRRQVADRDISYHSPTLGELNRHRSKLIEKLTNDLSKASAEQRRTDEIASRVIEKYRAEDKELPAALINRQTLISLQDEAISLGLAEQVESFEQLRVALAREHGQPTRDDKEAARLVAQLFTAETELRVKDERVERFEETRHLQKWEIGKERWSLVDLDRRIEQKSDEARLFGKHHFHLGSNDRAQAANEVARMTIIREDLLSNIEDRKSELSQEAEQARKLVEVLSEAYQNEIFIHNQQGRSLPLPEFTRKELDRIEANAETLRDASLLRQFNELEKRFGEQQPEHRLSRALAKEIIAELHLRQSDEQLAAFRERGEIHPHGIESPDGRLTIHKLRETRIRSIPDLIVRSMIEKPEAKQLREAIKAAHTKYYDRLASDQEKSQAYYHAARQSAEHLRSELGDKTPDKNLVAPAFTAREQMALEVYAERLVEPQDREQYLRLARGEGIEATRADEWYGFNNRLENHPIEQVHGQNIYRELIGKTR